MSLGRKWPTPAAGLLERAPPFDPALCATPESTTRGGKMTERNVVTTVDDVRLILVALISGILGLAGSAAAQTSPQQSSERSPLSYGKPSNSDTAPAPVDPALVRADMSELQKRVDIINRMADRFAPDAATNFGAAFDSGDWKRDFGLRLIRQPTAVLATAASAPNLGMAQNELFNASNRVQEKAFEDLRLNLLPGLPCRIVDTRNGGGGQLGPAYRFWYASTGGATTAAQGGNPAGCLSGTVEGFLLYVTVAPPTGNTGPNFLAVQTQNSPVPPTSAAINFVNQNIANFVISSSLANVNGYGFYAYSSGLAHVVVDLVGYIGHSFNPYALDCFTTATNNVSNQTGTNTMMPNAYNDLNVPVCGGTQYVQTATYCDLGLVGVGTVLANVKPNVCTLLTNSAHVIAPGYGASARCCRLGPGS
jgi:hypothetical protein